jgi:hypothetical protein
MAFLFRITLAVWATMSPAMAGDLVWKTEAFGANCKEVPQTAADQGEGDFVEYKCTSMIGPPMWQLFQEGVRQSIGFGRKPHLSMQYANADRGDWPLSWGGDDIDGKFTPLFVFARFTFFGSEPRRETLIVFKLMPDGTSCIVGGIEPVKDQNVIARKMAEDHRALEKCPDEVTMLE